MSKYNQYGIDIIYVDGRQDTLWYFIKSHRDRLLFDMRRRQEIDKVKPIKRKVQ